MDYEVRLNPDKAFIADLIERIRDNNGYCPSHEEKSIDTLCPCKDFRDSYECTCGLYIKERIS